MLAERFSYALFVEQGIVEAFNTGIILELYFAPLISVAEKGCFVEIGAVRLNAHDIIEY